MEIVLIQRKGKGLSKKAAKPMWLAWIGDEILYIFFDWTDSCISHPFFDLFELFFIRSSKFCVNQFQSFWHHYYYIPQIRNTYLAQWLDYESKDRLLEAWTIAKPLCALHHAITYQFIIDIL